MNTNWKTRYEAITAKFRTHTARPLIGITGNYDQQTCTLAEGYYQSVLAAGGTPVILPPFEPADTQAVNELLEEMLHPLDAIIFSGGGDINPLLVGEQPVQELHSVTPERDLQELLLARLAYDRQIPMLGICKGIQVINAALGGKNWQDINTQMDGKRIKHSQQIDRRYSSHTVSLSENSLLSRIFNTSELSVNSFHHQACSVPALCLTVSAISSDGVIEAVESNEFKSILGVQWHPETYILRGSHEMLPVFEWLVGEAAEFAEAKRLHKSIVTLDSHCDTPMVLAETAEAKGWGAAFAMRNPATCVDLQKMIEGHLDASIIVAYLEQKDRDAESLLAATAKANLILDRVEEMVATNCTAVDIARCPDDIIRLKADGKRAVMLGIENGYAIGRDLSNIERFRKRGVVYMTLCHNGDNDICDSCRHSAHGVSPLRGEHGGVSEYGSQVISEMNRVGMLIDMSHASEESFYDALRLSSQPIVCSHSSARALCDHPRNLTDQQMKALAEAGGVAQVTLYHGFLTKDSPEYHIGPTLPDEATILTAIQHLNHMVNVMGIDHVGIGTDFDGDGGIRGCACASELINFTRRLLRERYSTQQIQQIWGGNFMRVMRQVQNV